MLRHPKKLLFAIFTLCLVSVFGISATPVSAQEKGEGIGISPTQLNLAADPGETIKGNFTILNTGTSKIRYKTYVTDFSIRNEAYEKNFEPAPGTVSPVEWVQVPTDIKEVAANKQTSLEYSITVPENATPRGYYAVIFAEAAAPEADATGVARIKRVGMLVYLTVNGKQTEKGSVASYDVDFWQQDRPLKASLRIQNSGSSHFRVEGKFRLRDVFGRQIAQADLNGNILPDTIRKFTPELKLSQPFGIYKIEGEVNYLGQKTVLPGKWVVAGSPFWIILWTVLIVGWAIVLIRWIKRRAKHKKQS